MSTKTIMLHTLHTQVKKLTNLAICMASKSRMYKFTLKLELIASLNSSI